ncbi:Nitronate monooxygenase [Limnobacter sp. 130]|uniref:NAD(P)H-dependent flavin oxidoreductase n=1 Tax=Limnobacter sp. 130 TaxID=2653147 RepID=UPI0012EF0DBE|nr:nitronate monooxygenase [Limnobacter sp. 130]VWX36208.1 Nitronate monooxygenase [Limnobacter sp. 130]
MIFNTKYPIVQAPMAGVQTSALCIAVSNAGGLGSLPCAMLSAEQLRAELLAIRAGTDQPYNVNFFAHTPPEINAARNLKWKNTLAPYYREFGLNIDEFPSGQGRTPFNAESAELLEEFKPPIVSFHFGLPKPELLKRVKAMGAQIISSATTVDEAIWLQANGCDFIIAQGLEAGGHRGHFLNHDLNLQMGTFALLPQVVKAVQVPVIAAGGIANPQGVAAAMALGASAVQVGTAYLLAPECSTSAIHRKALQSEAARHTALTNLFSGRPARGIVNRVIRELGALSESPPEFPLATPGIAPLRAKAESMGSGDFSPLWAGQNASECTATAAAETTRRLVSTLLPVKD